MAPAAARCRRAAEADKDRRLPSSPASLLRMTYSCQDTPLSLTICHAVPASPHPTHPRAHQGVAPASPMYVSPLAKRRVPCPTISPCTNSPS